MVDQNNKVTKRNIREVAHYVIAGLIILSVSYILKKLFDGEIPLNNHDAIMLVIGNIMGWGTTMVSFYFGSSKGSEDKTELLARNNQNTNNSDQPKP